MKTKKSYELETFTSWAELIVQLEYAYILYGNSQIADIYAIHKSKFISHKSLQNFNKKIELNPIDINMSDLLVSNDIYYKWLEVRAYSYNYIQYARSLGGTLGHRVGCLHHFIESSFKEHEDFLKSFYDFERQKQ